jgi:hypothetical protein
MMKLCHYPEQFAQEALGYNSKAVHIGVVVLVVMHQCVNHPTRFLRGGGIVEINQRLAMNFLIQNRKILAQRGPVNCFQVLPGCSGEKTLVKTAVLGAPIRRGPASPLRVATGGAANWGSGVRPRRSPAPANGTARAWFWTGLAGSF